MIAYFGGVAQYEAIGKDWNKFSLLRDSADYKQLLDRDNAPLADIGYDPNGQVTLEDLAKLAEKHGGKLLSNEGGVYDRLQWENCDGVQFSAKGYTVMCGHWINPCYGKRYYPEYPEYSWDFDRLAKKDELMSQVWYDSHDVDEDNFYYYDDNFEAKYRKTK